MREQGILMRTAVASRLSRAQNALTDSREDLKIVDRETAAQRHRQLSGEGWEWRFAGDAKQVSVLKETYASLGMETLVEYGAIGRAGDCTSCFEGEGHDYGYHTLYTRGKAVESGRFDDDLFEE